MKQHVANAIDELDRAFPSSSVSSREDGSGGAYVIVENVAIGPRYEPSSTWLGGHITAPVPLRRHLPTVHWRQRPPRRRGPVPTADHTRSPVRATTCTPGLPAQQPHAKLSPDGGHQVLENPPFPGRTLMTNATCEILVTALHHERLMAHLFPGDNDEHGAILHAGVVRSGSSLRLLIQNVQPAEFGTDYVAGQYGYRALTPTFIHREIIRCRDSGLAYLAVHNHRSDRHVDFSRIDLASHERGYPALLDIGLGIPVGALVYGHRSVAADIWMPDGTRRSLSTYRVIGRNITRLYSQPPRARSSGTEHDRQIRMFGASGQHILRSSKVAVVGLGGVGSLIVEYLARLGVGTILMIDPDPIESSNLSRVVGSTPLDVEMELLKSQIAVRHAREMALCRDPATYRRRRGNLLHRSDAARLRLHIPRCRLYAGAACRQCPCPPVPNTYGTGWSEDTTR